MDAPFSPTLRTGEPAPTNETPRRDPPLTSAPPQAATERGGDAVQPEPRARVVEPRAFVPEPRSSFDPRATLGEPRATTSEPRIAVQEQRPQPTQQARVTVPPVTADLPLEGAEEAALRDIGEDPAIRARHAKSDEKAAVDEPPVKKVRHAAKADDKDDRRANRRMRREAKGRAVSVPAPATARALDKEFEKPVRKREPKTKTARRWTIPWTALSFIIMVLIPGTLATVYYVLWASPQYQVESQFSVRTASQTAVTTLIPMISGGGGSAQDSYIITSYIESLQLVRDVQQQLGIDLRQFYTRDNIDWFYRIDPTMPLEKFTGYWRDMTDVSFNATTGNTTLYIYAFSAEDAKAIADAVIKVSEKLVNDLSESNRQQAMQLASKQVDRSEERLRKVQGEVRKVRETEKVLSAESAGALLNQQISSVQTQLGSTKTRLSALLQEVDKNAPQARSMKRTIDSLEAQLAELQSQLDAKTSTSTVASKTGEPLKQNVAEVFNKFEELNVELGFATQAYTTALAGFEASIAEAQKQERYFATFVSPMRPEIALYPLRWLDSFIAFLVLLAFWLLSQFLYRSFRDHAI